MRHEAEISASQNRDHAARLRLLHGTLRREAHVLAEEPGLFCSHIHNMLLVDGGMGDAATLLVAARQEADRRPWLRLTGDPSVDRNVLLELLEHRVTVWHVAWSPAGDRLASAGSDGVVRVWDARRGDLVAQANPGAGPANAVAWSPGGELASGHDDGTVRLWDAADLASRAALDVAPGGVLSLAWSPDGEHLAVGAGRGQVIAVEGSHRNVRRFGKHAAEVYAVAWSPDGAVLASGGADAAVRLWERPEGFRLRHILQDRALLEACVRTLPEGTPPGLVFHQASVLALAWSPDGSSLVASSRSGTLRFWDPVNGTPGHHVSGEWSLGAGVWSLAWSADGLLAVGVGSGQVILADPERRQEGQLPLGHAGAVRDLAFGPGASALASCGDDGTVRVWDARALWERMPSLSDPARLGCRAAILRTAWSGDGLLLTASDYGPSATSWDARSGQRIGGIERLPGPALAMAPDGRGVLLAALETSADATVTWWNGSECEPEERFTVPGPVTSLALSPDGGILASGDAAGTVTLTTAAGGATYGTFTLETALEAAPDGPVPSRPMPVWGLAWSPDGRFVAAAGKPGLIVWDTRNGGRRQSALRRPGTDTGDDADPGGETGFGDEVVELGVEDHPVAWSPDGALLAWSSSERAIRLCRPLSGELVHVLDEHEKPVSALAWSEDGTLLASGAQDTTVRVWEASTGRRVALAHCLSGVMSVRFEARQAIRAVDDGAATALRPIPYAFELRGVRG